MADMTTIKGKIQKTIYPNGTGAITAEAHQQLLLDLVDDINKKKQDVIPGGAPFSEKGRYPDLSVGFADELNGHGESTPAEFTFRASGGKSIKDGTARIKRIKGNSIVIDGKVIHMTTERIKSVGDNAWDEQWEKGIIVDGENVESEVNIRSKNYIPIIGGEDYHYANKAENLDDYMNMFFYDENKNLIDTLLWSIGTFSTPANARYMRFYINESYGGVYNHDIILTLAHSGWKSDPFAPYQPYWVDYNDTSVIRKYFPDGMKKAGTAHDEIRYNKFLQKWEYVQKIGAVDMGSLEWFDYRTGSGVDSFAAAPTQDMKQTQGHLLANILTAAYPTKTWGDMYDGLVEGVGLDDYIRIVDSNVSGVNELLQKLQGITLYYELTEPIIREISEPFNPDYRVADFGTEEAISSIPSAPFSADIVYGFNAVDMIRELWIKVQELESIINK